MRQETEGKVVQAGKYNCVCPGIRLINLSTSKHKCSCFTPGPKLAWAKPSWESLPSAPVQDRLPPVLRASRDVPWSHVCSLPRTGITCSPDTCGAAAMPGMLGTSGGIWDWVNLIILLLIAFEIHLVIGRRCLVPITVDGSWPAEVSAWQECGDGDLGQGRFSFKALGKRERNRNACV